MESQYSRHKILALSIILAVFTIGTISVTGLLQSTRSVSSSGIIVTPPPPPPTGGGGGGGSPPSPPPPEPTVEISVYSDEACTQTLSNIVWGEMVAGDYSTARIYIKNSGDIGVVLSLSTDGWNPANAPSYMNLSWDYNGASINPEQVVAIDLTLDISVNCPALPVFNFNIIIIGS